MDLLIKAIPLTVIFILGGLNWVNGKLILLVISLVILLPFKMAIFRHGVTRYPEFTKPYLIFLLLLFFNIFWSYDILKTFEFLILFSGGYLFWLFFRNTAKHTGNGLVVSIILTGIIFAAIYMYRYIIHLNSVLEPWTLYGRFSLKGNHYLLGELWSVVNISSIYVLLDKKVSKNLKYFLVLLTLFGMGILFVSGSRTAFLSFMAGLFILFRGFRENRFKNRGGKHARIIFILLFIAATLGFIWIGAGKSTYNSRPYYVQAIRGLVKYPFGVGAGNFSKISREFCTGECEFDYSTHVLNIILEIVAGLGLFSAVFIYWLAKITAYMLKSKKMLPAALFFTLLTNFFFGPSYMVPAMLWICFAAIGFEDPEV